MTFAEIIDPRPFIPTIFGNLILACATLIPVAAHASPLEVDDLDAAETAELAVTTAVESTSTETLIEGPVLELAFPLVDGLELSVGTGIGHSQIDGAPDQWGWLDTAIGLKGELLSVGELGGIGVTIAPALILPTGSHGLGDDGWIAEVPVIIALVRGPLQLRGLIGVVHDFSASDSEMSYGIAAETEVSTGFLLGAELVGGMDGLFVSQHSLNANLGFTIALDDSLELRGRAGHSLSNDDNEDTIHGLLTLQMSF